MLQQEQQKLDIKRAQRLYQEAAQDYRDKSIIEEADGRIRNLEMASWIPSVFSIVTASFLVFYLAQPYTLLTKIGIIIILGAVIIVNEIIKRRTVKQTVQSVHKRQRPSFIIAAAAVLTMMISMGSSFLGGNSGVQENVPRPTLAPNPTIDSLKKEVSKYDKEIAAYQATTWRGKVVNDVRPMLRVATDNRNITLQEISRIEGKQAAEHQATLSKFEQQLISFGIIFGGLAALCDFFLIGISAAIERTRRDLYDAIADDPDSFAQVLLHSTGSLLPKGPTPPPEPPKSRRPRDPKVRDLHDRHPAPTEAHHSDEQYDPADLVDATGCNPVATLTKEEQVDLFIASYKDARKRYRSYIGKNGYDDPDTSPYKEQLDFYQAKMYRAVELLEDIGAIDEIEKLEEYARA